MHNLSFEDALKVFSFTKNVKNVSHCKFWYNEGVLYNQKESHNRIKKVNYYYPSFAGESHIAMSLELNLPSYLRVHALGVLKETLKKDVNYNYSYHIKSIDNNKLAYITKNAQFLFSNEEKVDPFKRPKDNLQGDISEELENGWYKILETYKAKGNEKYIILNFFDNNKTNTFKTKKCRKKNKKCNLFTPFLNFIGLKNS